MSLTANLLADDQRPAVIADLSAVVDAEVREKSGLSGAAIKTGYAAARKLAPNLTERGLNRMLPDFAAALDPFWADLTASGQTDFGAYLVGRGDEATEALLGVADKRVLGSDREGIKKAYRGLRGKAEEHVRTALPRVGAAIQNRAG